MKKKYDTDLLVTVSRMYYLDGLKQDEIAKRVNVSRSLISLILTEAKELGIVDIKINDPRSNEDELAREFLNRFDIEQCIVVPTSVKEPDFRLDLAVQRGIEVFNKVVSRGDTIGIAWGKTCYQFMTDYTNEAIIDDLKIVPLVGSSNRSLRRYQMNEVVREFAEKVHGTARFIHAPTFPVSRNDYHLYMKSSTVQTISSFWAEIDIAIISIGASPRLYSDIVAESIERGGENTSLIAEKAVGDICARFFDESGHFIEEEIAQITIAIPVENLRKAKTCICIVSGDNKIASIIAGLKTGLVDVLITDETTARRVVDRIEREESGSASVSSKA